MGQLGDAPLKELWSNIADMFSRNFATAGLLCAAMSLTVMAASPRAPIDVPREVRGNLILEGVPEPDAATAANLARYLAVRDASFRDFLPDGQLLISTRFGETEQLHRLAMPLGAREQLTFFDEPVGSALARGGSQPTIAFLKDQGGNENAQVQLFSLADRSVRLLTDGKSLHGGIVWSRDGRRLAFHGNGRDGISYDIFVAETDSDTAPRLVVAGQQRHWSTLDWSPDDRRLLLRNYVSIHESYLFVADIATGTLSPVDAAKPGVKVGIGTARFSADGRTVLLTSDRDSEYLQLRQVDLGSGEVRVLSTTPWDIEDFELSRNGRYLAYVANVDGLSRLQVIDLGLASERLAAPLPAGIISDLRFDPTGERLGLTINSARAPRDVYTLEIESNTVTRWTQSETGNVAPDAFVDAARIRYPTWDRTAGGPRQIPAFVYRPATPGKHPVVISIHGGPQSQYRPTFDPLTQYLVNELGYAVVAPNVRGSSGYGKSYLKLDNGMLREDAVRDIGSLLVWIGAQPDLDPARVVVTGGSYGGYMVLASLVQYGDRLQGGVNVVGISNFVTFLQNTSPYRRDLRREEYGDERDVRMRGFLTRISPLTNAERINKPLLIVQGLNDPRVPASESEQMVRRIRANGGQVAYLAAADEGHGFRKKSNRDFYQRSVIAFLQSLNP